MAYINGEHLCDHCNVSSDDGLTTVVVELGEKQDWGFPGCDPVLQDWCADCVSNVEHHGLVRDSYDEDAQRDAYEADAYDRD